ncbi:hypothetical protein CRM22_007387 [Opisthorchis felineus]|uniref:dual-specificity kinase n=1 Tax=Opisthorchis felineus TaxID=147828 RepID=A0A4S2LGD8_OPIFE|nr:hypothetical protein CRM22_007387 [Opisthorchis felineus]
MYTLDKAPTHSSHLPPLTGLNGSTTNAAAANANANVTTNGHNNGSSVNSTGTTSFCVGASNNNLKPTLNITQLYEDRQHRHYGDNASIATSNSTAQLHLPSVSLGPANPSTTASGARSGASGIKPGVGSPGHQCSKMDNHTSSLKIRNRAAAGGGGGGVVIGGTHTSISNSGVQPISLVPGDANNTASHLTGGSCMSVPNTFSSHLNGAGLTPEMAMKLYVHKLSVFEHHEIFSYPHIYFVGHNAKKRAGVVGAPNNSGYDDEQGSYLNTAHDHVAYRYEVLKILGKGSFGQVVKAYDHKTGTYVALKMVRNEKRFTHQAAEEIRILELLKQQDKDNTRNVVHMLENFTFRNHVCMTFELLSMNLYELIKRSKFQGFPLQLVRKFAHSILVCLDMLHRNKIIHCDLKPENILLKQQGRSGIKVIDFGSSCFESQRIYTYIQSRFYRAPEVILGFKYGTAIDVWSFGCILAELLTGAPLFPGEDEGDQLACIIELLGMPPQKLLDQCRRVKHFFSTTHGYPRYCMATDSEGRVVLRPSKSKRGKIRGTPGSRSLVTALGGCEDTAFLDFLRRCLQWLPEDRMTPREAFRHEWLRRRLPKPPGNTTSAASAVNTWTGAGHIAQPCTAAVAATANTLTTLTLNASVSMPTFGTIAGTLPTSTANGTAGPRGPCPPKTPPHENQSPHIPPSTSTTSTKPVPCYPHSTHQTNWNPSMLKSVSQVLGTAATTELPIAELNHPHEADSHQDAGDQQRPTDESGTTVDPIKRL